MTQTPLVTITAAGRAGGVGGYRFRHGWIRLDGQGKSGRDDDSATSDRGAAGSSGREDGVRAARSEGRARLDAALSRLDKVNPEVGRRQRAQLNELRESGKLTPDRMRIATDAANRLAVPNGHAKAGSPTEGLGADKFGPKAADANRDGGNGGHGGTGPDTKPSSSGAGVSVRGDSAAAKAARRNIYELSGASPSDRAGQLRKMSDVELRNTHEAVRAEHKYAQSQRDKAGLKELSEEIRAEHTRRKAEKSKAVTAAGRPLVALVAASDASVSRQQKDQEAAKKVAPAKKSGGAAKSSSSKSSSSKSSGGSGGGSFDEGKHPRQPAGSGDKSGEFAPAGGGGKDDAGKKAQQNKTAQANFLKLAGMNPADSKKFLAGLSEKDLTELTEIAYSAKTSDKKVVTQRGQISSEMTKRGISIQDHGARGGGLPKGAGKKPAAKKAPAKTKAKTASAAPLVVLGGDTLGLPLTAACDGDRVQQPLVRIGGTR